MFRREVVVSAFVFLALAAGASSVPGSVSFSQLEENQKIAEFAVEAVYEGENDRTLGARFRHIKSGFVADVLSIQSIPQAFMWVNTPPRTDQGEPHTLEHLLLGKGNRGKYVASLENMSLGRSSAFTMQLRTCYHFNTSAGIEVFFNLLDAKLNAMLHPNFSDEEIRREVCNMGIRVDPNDSTLALEEKGTVYSEMVSSFERPTGDLYYELGRLLYGEDHPLSYSAGGTPVALRTLTPEEIRDFHQITHHLSNMGAAITIPDDVPIEQFLDRLNNVLVAVEPEAEAGPHPEAFEQRIPEASPAPVGTIRQVTFPHQNENEPCLLLFGWQPDKDISQGERVLLELLIQNLSSGQTSDLFSIFINTQTRVMDIGATAVFGWVDWDKGHPIYIGFSNVRKEATTHEMIDSVRTLILSAISRIAALPDDSEELQDFNDRALNRIMEHRKELRDRLNAPPRFGYRGTGSDWMQYLHRLHLAGGFRRSLMLEKELKFAEDLLNSTTNPWRAYVEKWRLIADMPYAVATRPAPDRIEQAEDARAGRIQAFTDSLISAYSVSTQDEAFRRYSADYDSKTEVIEATARTVEMPKFIESPPLTLDNNLQYTVDTLVGGGDMVASTFNNMTSSTCGLAFDMYTVPESLLIYVGALPSFLTDVGLYRDGHSVAFDQMQEMIRRQILDLRAYYSTNYRTERVELVFRASGSNADETDKAVEWLNNALLFSNLRPDNLSRIRDVVDLSLGGIRNRMRRSEESWVNIPVNGYWKQTNPLLLNADCFLTQKHALLRLRWRLKEIGDQPETFGRFMSLLADLPVGKQRSEIFSLLDTVSDTTTVDAEDPRVNELVSLRASASESSLSLMDEVLEDLRTGLSDLPDATLEDDWMYLCALIAEDLNMHPNDALAEIIHLLDIIRNRNSVRSFVIGSESNQAVLRPALEDIVSRLSDSPVERQEYSPTPVVVSRLKGRVPDLDHPLFVGLINENTRNGVHINRSDCASFEDYDPDRLLKFLSARLYGGGGAHSMFMKTWGAGLAYSNGLRSNEYTGQLSYYAERCPDLAQTMQFVVGELKKAPYDPSLAEYAIAQAFAANRAGARFEARGERMAEDLADGLTPEVVARFREGILELRKSENLYDTLHTLMEQTYGEILPGYGIAAGAAAERSNAIYYVIGPEKQLQSYEEYLKSVEGDDVVLQRIYPRDYWITTD